jgi:hypothetical protein
VLIGYVIGHIGDDAISARFVARALKAESKLAARSLSDAEVAEIAASLKQFSQQEFAIASYGGEAASLAVRLKQLLESAGWKWFEPQSQILPLPGTVGIQVWAYSEGSGRDAARTLVKALNDKSIDAMLLPAEKAQSSPDNKIEIIVGAKF